MKKDIRAYGYEELQKEMATIGEKAFRAKQIYEWRTNSCSVSTMEM